MFTLYLLVIVTSNFHVSIICSSAEHRSLSICAMNFHTLGSLSQSTAALPHVSQQILVGISMTQWGYCDDYLVGPQKEP